MKKRFVLFVAAVLSLGYLAAGVAAAQEAAPTVPDHLTVNINTQQTADPVSKYVFGSFIEHIGPTIYRSMWDEMLDDRKFYFPINSEVEAAPARRGGGGRGMPLRKWRPVGPDEAVTMDKNNPFVGEQSPRIALDGSTPHGISQTGLSLLNGKKYTGRVYLRGTPGTKVKVSLAWGDGPNDRQTVAIGEITSEYKKFPLSFTAGADTSTGTFEVAATGSGNLHVGTASLMPADNIDGFRPDTIALLRKLHSGMWRLPGGNFLSDWDWHQAIGDVDKRPPMFDYAWNQMQVNDVGMDELMTFCKLIDVDPYVTVNAGLGDANSAAEEVEYLNGPATSYWGAKRAKNGHPEPYHIHMWNIGNEPWGTFQIGYTPLKYYVIKNNDFAAAMRKEDPSIELIASAKMMEPGWLKGEDRAKYVDNLAAGAYGSDEDWTGGLLAKSWGTFSGIAQHWYEGAGRHFNLQKAKALPPDAPATSAYDTYDPTTLEYARYAGDVILRHVEEWQGYQQRFPQMIPAKTFMSLDEYAYGGGGGGGRGGPDLKSALAYGMLLDEMMRHTDIIGMGAHTMGTSSLDITPTASVINAVGLVYELYGEHFPGTIPVAVTGNSPQPATDSAKYGDEPKVSSGSPTYPLDVFAALTPDHKYLNVAVVNATDHEQKFDMSAAGAHLAGPSTLWQLTGSSLEAADHVGQPAQVEIKEIPMSSSSGAITVAPISVNVYRFPVAE